MQHLKVVGNANKTAHRNATVCFKALVQYENNAYIWEKQNM